MALCCFGRPAQPQPTPVALSPPAKDAAGPAVVAAANNNVPKLPDRVPEPPNPSIPPQANPPPAVPPTPFAELAQAQAQAPLTVETSKASVEQSKGSRSCELLDPLYIFGPRGAP